MRDYRGLTALCAACAVIALAVGAVRAQGGRDSEEIGFGSKSGEERRPAAVRPEAPGQPRGPRIVIDGQALTGVAYMLKGQLVGPVRPFLEALGARVWWDARKQEVRAQRGEVELGLKAGEARVRGGKAVVKLPRAPWTRGGRMYGPLLALAKALGDSVKWDDRSRVARISTSGGGQTGPGAGKQAAIAAAVEYLKRIDEYPDTVTSVDAHRGQAPANRYWEALKSGGEIVSDAPERACWIVQINYHGLVPDGWKQVYVEEASGKVIGGQQTR